MRSKKDFFFEDTVRIKGAPQTVNVVQGLELHKGLLNAQEQAHIVTAIEAWAEAGRAVRHTLPLSMSLLKLRVACVGLHGV